MNYATDFKSIRNDVPPQEWQTRVDLAACYRLVDAYGMTDLIYNHITARIPGTEHLLINLYGLLYREITAPSPTPITASTFPAMSSMAPFIKRDPTSPACCTPIRAPAWRWRR